MPTIPIKTDLLIIGGGINGVGIARDASGRGLSVMLVEQDELASHTSSASSKLIHGGLRYLEHGEFRLVREALRERSILLRLAPDLIRPLTFVLPHAPHVRPAWMIRLGLFLYDRLGPRGGLPASRAVDLAPGHFGDGLKSRFRRGFTYADAQVDDVGLVRANAIGARQRGADIRTHTRFISAHRIEDGWRAMVRSMETGTEFEVDARVVVNAAGPWVGSVLDLMAGSKPERPPRLVKGSHIVVRRMHAGDHAYILQNPDGRVVFAIPWQGEFTLIGTTDIEWTDDPSAPAITPQETAYLCDAVNEWFERPIGPADVIRSFSGIRSLYDDGKSSASQVTRDYVLAEGPHMLSVFGGKITTYRRLAEHALAKLERYFPDMTPEWTADAPLEEDPQCAT